MNNLIELLKFEAKNINNLFEQASIEGEGTPQEVSDRIIFQTLLINYVPSKRFNSLNFRSWCKDR